MSGGAGSFMQLHTATISARYFRLQPMLRKADRMGGLLIMIMIVFMSRAMLMIIKMIMIMAIVIIIIMAITI